MSISTALVAIKSANSTLNTLVGTRFHPEVLPQGVTLPACRFQVISRQREYQFGVVPTLAHPRVQIDGYASTDAARATLATAMRGAFNRYNSAGSTIGGETILDMRIDNEIESVEQLDTNTQARRIMMDLIVDIRE